MGKRYLRFPLTIFFPMLDGETKEQAEDRMIERIDPDEDVVSIMWNEGKVEVVEDDDETDAPTVGVWNSVKDRLLEDEY